MKRCDTLPENYREIYTVDLQKNKKTALLINGIAVLIAVPMIVAGHFFVPVSVLFDVEKGFGMYFLRFGVLLVSIVLYMILHELVHGVAMKLCGTKKVKYGYTGMYAYAGSADYYAKRPYIFIALAPVVLWGVVLAVLCPFLPTEWFWVGYFVQVNNCSGAAGDLFVTAKFLRMPRDILVHDSGVSMTVYSAENIS